MLTAGLHGPEASKGSRLVKALHALLFKAGPRLAQLHEDHFGQLFMWVIVQLGITRAAGQ